MLNYLVYSTIIYIFVVEKIVLYNIYLTFWCF